MEEDEYRNTYQQIASVGCAFEKALTNNKARCSYAIHFCLADREGYTCQSEECAAICSQLLQNLRDNSRFSLKLKSVGSALPHNMEIRVQAGGLMGLQKALAMDTAGAGQVDIRGLVDQAVEKFGKLDALPYADIVKSVAQFKGRKRRNRLQT
jgi:hypothetical protein